MDKPDVALEALPEPPLEENEIKTEVKADEEFVFVFETSSPEPQLEESQIKVEDKIEEEFQFKALPEPPVEENQIKTEIKTEEVDVQSSQDEDGPTDPLIPTLRKQPLDSQAKLMILNVHKYFQKFKIVRAIETGEDMNVSYTVAEACGVSESIVKKILQKYRRSGIESAIAPPILPGNNKRNSDIVKVGEVKKKRPRKNPKE